MISQVADKWTSITRWAALAGNWEFSDQGARYQGPSTPGGYGLAVCDERLRDGLVRAQLRFEGADAPLKGESAGIVLGYHSESRGYLVVGLGAFDLNKPTILLAQRGRDLPFDIRSYRVIFYDDSIGGKPLVEKTLREHLHAILQDI